VAKPAKSPTIRSIRPAVDQQLVEGLEEWLAMAKRGELTGAVLLGNRRGDETVHRWCGDIPLSIALLVFEQYKYRVMLERW
jgi:hypothetical protein